MPIKGILIDKLFFLYLSVACTFSFLLRYPFLTFTVLHGLFDSIACYLFEHIDCHRFTHEFISRDTYSRTSVARTLMARLLWLFRTRS